MAGAGQRERRRQVSQRVAILTDLEWPVLAASGTTAVALRALVAILTDLEWPVLV